MAELSPQWLVCFEHTEMPPSPERVGQLTVPAPTLIDALTIAETILDDADEPYEIVVAGRADRMCGPAESETIQ